MIATIPWQDAIERIADAGAATVLVIGATDVGKSSFVRALMDRWREAGHAPVLVDADPGQKMVGPPGTISLEAGGRLAGMIFIGTTSAGQRPAVLAQAAGRLAQEARRAGPVVVNSSGFVERAGIALNNATIRSVVPDWLVAIGPELAPILAANPAVPLLRLDASPLAQRKSPRRRAANRRRAFAEHLAGAEAFTLPREGPRIEPALPCLVPQGPWPVCALVDADGRDQALGLVEAVTADALRIVAVRPAESIASIRLGWMWARPDPAYGWRLLDRLAPAWEA